MDKKIIVQVDNKEITLDFAGNGFVILSIKEIGEKEYDTWAMMPEETAKGIFKAFTSILGG